MPSFELWEEHLAAWEAWSAIATQWRVVAISNMEMGRVVWMGLDYGAAKAGLDLAGMNVTPATWAEVRCIEEGATLELNHER